MLAYKTMSLALKDKPTVFSYPRRKNIALDNFKGKLSKNSHNGTGYVNTVQYKVVFITVKIQAVFRNIYVIFQNYRGSY